MRTLITAAVVVLSVLTGCARPVWAQSLGDLARQEEERRKTIKSVAKVYTNKDLGNAQPPPPPVASAGQAASTAAATPAAGGRTGATGSAAPTGSAGRTATDGDNDKGVQKDQAYWAGRMKELNTQLARDEASASEFQNQVNSLTSDFINQADPTQRSIIEQNRARALSEFARLQKEIEKDRNAIADLQEEGRRAGAPPGWLR
jgi:hypothetical protein